MKPAKLQPEFVKILILIAVLATFMSSDALRQTKITIATAAIYVLLNLALMHHKGILTVHRLIETVLSAAIFIFLVESL